MVVDMKDIEEPKKMDYGKRLKNIRNYELHTQKNIAKILGISENTYTQYELQNQTIPLKHLVAFCDYYNIYLDYILGFSKIEKIENTKNVNNRLPISEIIKKIRKDLNLTVKNFAESIDIPRTTLTNYEKGRYMMSLDCLYSICRKYNISADYITGRINQQKIQK